VIAVVFFEALVMPIWLEGLFWLVFLGFLKAKNKVYTSAHFLFQCRLMLGGWQVHGKLNTHTGAAHGIAQLKRKFFPEVRESTVTRNYCSLDEYVNFKIVDFFTCV
jgi:hypothetical protein